MTKSTDRPKQPIAQDAYNQVADAYAERVGTKPHNAYYERPATLSLLPDLKGQYVLDAGCGPGVYAEILVGMGAEVVAMDANPKMVAYAQTRLGGKALVIEASLEDPLVFFDDQIFDVIIAPLVMDYIKNWQATFEEFYRVLKPGGALVFSMEHPMMKYFDHREGGNYFDVEWVTYTWRGFGTPVEVPSYRRSLAEIFNPLIKAGFTLDTVLEPLPTEEFKVSSPKDYEELTCQPGFMCIRAVKTEELNVDIK
ncbi:MAG: class I SAM-dependent methyltransferase [Brevefilum sp.]|nr:class I SAM-dependent methyltransferase [Brevefilum sp.]